MSDPRTEHAAELLDAWGQAIRGDWGGIDGRSCRAQLSLISDYLRGERETLHPIDINVCLEGGAHWYGEGWDHKCYEMRSDR